jgi:hypothetical protein
MIINVMVSSRVCNGSMSTVEHRRDLFSWKKLKIYTRIPDVELFADLKEKSHPIIIPNKNFLKLKVPIYETLLKKHMMNWDGDHVYFQKLKSCRNLLNITWYSELFTLM